jgi:dephospho-CoA kinase
LNTKVIVGITGGIGSGKTFVCQILKAMGYPVFFSDQEAKNILIDNQTVKQQITDLFGTNSYLENGELNRKHLSNQIFNNKNLLEQMNQIVHPAVRSAFKEWTNQQTSRIVFNEAAIIFETGIYKNYDHVILVTAQKETKIKRIKKRDNSTIQEIEKRMKSQWSDKQKKPLASFIINNDDHIMLLPQINKIVEQLIDIR